MGTSTSSFKSYYSDEFDRLQNGKHHLTVSDTLKIKLPRSPYIVSTGHLGVLYLLDRDHDGQITQEDMHAFIEMAAVCSERFKRHEFQYLMQGYCLVLLWHAVHTEDGRREFGNWLCKAVTQGCATEVRKKAYRNVQCVEARAVGVLHEIMDMHAMNKASLPDFTLMCKDELAAAGGTGEAEATEDELGAFVPVQAIRRFGESVVDGIARVMGGVYDADTLSRLQVPSEYSNTH